MHQNTSELEFETRLATLLNSYFEKRTDYYLDKLTSHAKADFKQSIINPLDTVYELLIRVAYHLAVSTNRCVIENHRKKSFPIFTTIIPSFNDCDMDIQKPGIRVFWLEDKDVFLFENSSTASVDGVYGEVLIIWKDLLENCSEIDFEKLKDCLSYKPTLHERTI